MKWKGNSLKKASLNKNFPIKLIGLNNFEKEVVQERQPVLLLCMFWNSGFHKQMGIIERISNIYEEELKVCLLEEEFIGAFRQRFGVIGTPTFLIFVAGSEKERLLGHADQESLANFLSRTLPLPVR